MPNSTEIQRRAATRAMLRYFALLFLVFATLSGTVIYAVWNSHVRAETRRILRLELCEEIEKLKTQNREDVAVDKKNFPRTLRLLKLKNTAEIRRVAEEGWDRTLQRNAPRSCPYRA